MVNEIRRESHVHDALCYLNKEIRHNTGTEETKRRCCLTAVTVAAAA